MSKRSIYPHLFDSESPAEPILSKLNEAAGEIEKEFQFLKLVFDIGNIGPWEQFDEIELYVTKAWLRCFGQKENVTTLDLTIISNSSTTNPTVSVSAKPAKIWLIRPSAQNGMTNLPFAANTSNQALLSRRNKPSSALMSLLKRRTSSAAKSKNDFARTVQQW